MFEVKKLEERIAPTSGVFLGNEAIDSSLHGNGTADSVGNAMGNLSENAIAHDNAASANSNSVGNVVFSD